MIPVALQTILRCGGIPEKMAESVRFSAVADPVFPTQYRIATAGSAALGAVGLAMADIREAQTAKRPAVDIDVRGATASLRSSKYVRIDGKPPKERSGVVSGFYRAAEGRWNYFHCNHPPHQAALLRVLGVPGDKEQVAASALRWNAFKLEEAVDTAGGCAPAVRTPEEWRALPNTPALAAEPLIDIQKIADSAPMRLAAGERPLSGLRVLDLTRVLAGPTCGRLLAESGAEVLKLTCDAHPDSPQLEWDTGYCKRSATLDIRSPAGQEQFRSLLSRCDVFSQAYRPGALAGLGFSPEHVAKLRPGIVYVSLNAFGYTGEWRYRRGFDTVVQAASGMAYVSGRGKEPKFTPVSSLDYIAGYLMTYGALVALRRRHEEGGSYRVNVSLARCEEWMVGMGLLDPKLADSAVGEFQEINSWLIDVPTPLGRLTRLRPIIRYSEEALNTLPEWRDRGKPGAVWSD